MEARKRNLSVSQAGLITILESFSYSPPETGLYSTTGCKKVATMLDLYREDIEEREEREKNDL